LAKLFDEPHPLVTVTIANLAQESTTAPEMLFLDGLFLVSECFQGDKPTLTVAADIRSFLSSARKQKLNLRLGSDTKSCFHTPLMFIAIDYLPKKIWSIFIKGF